MIHLFNLFIPDFIYSLHGYTGEEVKLIKGIKLSPDGHL